MKTKRRMGKEENERKRTKNVTTTFDREGRG
jgi:hypothetical protein